MALALIMHALTIPVCLSPFDMVCCEHCIIDILQGAAWDEGEGPAQWLSSYLEKPCRLLRYAGVSMLCL